MTNGGNYQFFIIFLRDKYGEVNEVTNTSTHLGIYWRQKNDKSIHISQPGYVDKIIKELKMEKDRKSVV